MMTRRVLAGAVAVAALVLMTSPAAAQVSPPPPPQEVCDAIETAGSEVQGVEGSVSDATGESLPASPGSNIRSARFSIGCRFIDPDASTSPGSPAAPSESPSAEVSPASAGPVVVPAAAQTDVETLPVTGGGAAPLAGLMLALGAAARWLSRRA